MAAAAIYASVSSARQAKDETIGSQLAALREHAAASRPGMEALRDLAAQGCLDVVLVWSPDRLTRKFAYQALLIEEFARSGVRVEFVKRPRGDSPEDQPLIQRARRRPVRLPLCPQDPESGAFYEVVPHEAALVSEMFRRYADDGAAIADLGRWLTAQGVRTRTGKERWDRSVIWGVPRPVKTVDRPREEWTHIPSATTSSGKRIYYYYYRYQGGRVCGNKPVRADYADQVIWDHVTGLLADPALIRAEIDKRIERARTSDPVTRKRGQLEQTLAKTTASIAAMITAFSEQLLTIDELRTRMPALRARETGLKDQIAATATTEDRQRVLRAPHPRPGTIQRRPPRHDRHGG